MILQQETSSVAWSFNMLFIGETDSKKFTKIHKIHTLKSK